MAYTPSLTFLQEQKTLQDKLLVGEIDEPTYNKLIDELITREAQDQQSLIVELAIQELREAAWRDVEEKKKEEEQKKSEIEEKERIQQKAQQKVQQDEESRERARQLQEQMQKDREAAKKVQSRRNYREIEVPGEIALLKEQYETAQTRYTYLQIISVCASIIAASMVGLDVLPRWIVASFSAAAAIATGLLSTFKIRERNYSYYQAISSMETECHNYDQRIDRYADLDDEQAFRRFSSRISEIKQQHISQELAFWKAEEKAAHEEETQQSALTPKAESTENQKEQEDSEKSQVERSEQAKDDSSKEQSQLNESQ